ncbi:MAG TPA: thymidylate synthase [Actinomycetota bacterium]|nr:thymidylate synthase [Actinomycetota bacterium]
MTTATTVWRTLLTELLDTGLPTAQDSGGAEWRGTTSYEILACKTVWPMNRAVVLCPGRRAGYRFMAAEAAFILSGSNRLAEMTPYAPALTKLSDDGEFLTGAYGPRYLDDLPYVLGALSRDPATRQAVLSIWRPRPGPSKDISCTLALQLLIRPVNGRPTIHCVATMRSSDAWMGITYDVHAFSMIAAHVALHLRGRLGPLSLGNLYLIAGSQHLYAIDRDVAAVCAAREDELVDLKPLDLADFARPADLISHLWAFARKEYGDLNGTWLRELA